MNTGGDRDEGGDHPAPSRGGRRTGARKETILRTTADLVATRGYHSVAMADIGEASGITGPGIYRHFRSKSAVLVALFDRVVDELIDKATVTMTRSDRTPAEAKGALDELIRDQVLFAMEKRALLKVYLQEIHNLPEADRERLLAKQSRYVGQWIRATRASRSDLSASQARSLVHAAIGAIQSVLHYDSDLTAGQLATLMTAAARAVLLEVGPVASGSLTPHDVVTRVSVGGRSKGSNARP